MKDREEKKQYYSLIQLIKAKGKARPKRHGEYVSISVYDDYVLELDTWNKSIYVYKSGKLIDSLGIDFGGFRCDVGMVGFWFAHIRMLCN